MTISFLEQVEKWNQTEAAFPDKTLHTLFEEQVGRTPDAPAICFEGIWLTYAQFNARANQVAHLLRATCTIAPDTLIAICLERSEKMLITIMAALKAGGAYVPLDPEHPNERLKYILEDTGAKLLLTDDQHAERIKALAESGIRQIVLDDPSLIQLLAEQPATNPLTETRSNHLAYVIYTSGTTGRPKGVMIEHRGIVNRIDWMNRRYPLKPEDRILQKTPYVFDVSVWELFWAHCYGGSVVFAKPGGHQDPAYLIDLIEQRKISIVHFVPSMLGLFLKSIEEEKKRTGFCLSHLHTIFCSGEALPLQLVKKCHALLPNVALHNLYGPTEASVDALFYDCSSAQLEAVYIGKPIQNMRAYVLDERHQLAPVGVTGELYLSGVGLARGYWGNPVLTSEKFIPDPFEGKNSRLYKTGDLARWLPDGTIEYLGRNDFQIKLHGFRIELGEIEVILGQLEGVRQCIVLAEKEELSSQSADSSHFLVAYYLADEPLQPEMVRSFLSQKLPDYMVPHRFVQLPSFPLTTNGKVDRTALQRVKGQKCGYEAANSPLERSLSAIWEECFGLAQGSLGRLDDFFYLGGDSIVGLQIIGRIRQQVGLAVSMRELFKLRTVKELATYLEGKVQEVRERAPILSSTEGKQEIFPANSLQQGFIAHFLKQGALDDAYLVQVVWEYGTAIDVERLQQAWQQAVRCFGCLRMRFDWEQGLVQIIEPQGSLDWRTIDISATLEQEQTIESILHRDREERFNLSKGPLFRVYLIKLCTDRYLAIFTHHHAILDGWSVLNLLNQLHAHYFGKNELALSGTYQQVQHALTTQNLNHMEFWVNYLGRLTDKGSLTGLLKKGVLERVSEKKWVQRQKCFSFKLDKDCYSQLRNWSQLEGFTINAIVQFVWHKLLSIYSYTAQTVVGTTVSGRDLPIEGIGEAIGLFINTLPLIVEHDSEKSVVEAIRDIQEQLHQVASRSAVNLAELQKEGERLFDTLLVFENFARLGQEPNFASLKIQFKELREKLDYPLVLIAYEKGQTLEGQLLYADELFCRELLQELMDVMQSLLHQIAANPAQKVSELILVRVKVEQLVQSFPPLAANLQGLFEQHAEKSPSSVALIYQGQKISYAQLNERANRIAHCLKEKYAIKSNDLVALAFERSIEMMVAILATLKAGAVYLPIDPHYPSERIEYLLQDSQAKLFLKMSTTVSSSILHLDLDTDFGRYPATNLSYEEQGEQLAYVIYTSGTTGKPKAVMQTHHNVLRLLASTKSWFNFSSHDIWSLFHSYTFDFSVWEIWGAWAFGGQLIIPTEEQVRDPQAFYALSVQWGLTILNQTPTAFYRFMEYVLHDQRQQLIVSLRYIIFGGEMLHLALLKEWLDTFGAESPRLINMYGITETTVHVTYKQIQKEDLLSFHSSIGTTIPDMRAYILDPNGQLLPPGAIGELFIGGEGLARGYLNQPALTASRFMVNPFQTKEEKRVGFNSRLYKTGDLAVKNINGELFYVGRHDRQVKIRGYRVELGEIEACLNQHISVQQSVVISIKKDKEAAKQLVAYCVLRDRSTPINTLYDYLQMKLPFYLIPQKIICLEQFPRTANGKIDEVALSKMEGEISRNSKVPATTLERTLCQIWAKLLQMDEARIGVNESFFHLGGDSILVIRLVSSISQVVKRSISVNDIYAAPTIEKLAALLNEKPEHKEEEVAYTPFSLLKGRQLPQTVVDIVEDAYPAAALQNGMLLEGTLASKDTYHDIFCYSVTVPYQEEKFCSLWEQLVQAHPLLRAGFTLTGDEGWLVTIQKQLRLEIFTFNRIKLEEIVEEERKNPFNLQQAGLFRLLINDWGSHFDLIFSFHHAIADGWSIASLLNSFIQAYCLERKITLPSPLSYAQFVKEEQTAIADQSQLKFWQEYLEDWTATKLALKFDKTLSSNGLYKRSIRFELPQSQKLLECANALEVQLETLFLLAYLHTIAFYADCAEISIGLVTHNRLEQQQGDELLGLFLNTLPLRFKMSTKATIKENLQTLFAHRNQLRKYQRVPYSFLHHQFKMDQVDFIFNYIHFHILEESQLFVQNVYEFERTNIPFSLTVEQLVDKTVVVSTIVHDNYISLEYLEQFLDYYQQFVLASLEDCGRLWSELLPTLIGKRSVLEGPRKSFPFNKSVHRLFEEQALLAPCKTAVIDGQGALTYGELNRQASQLARLILGFAKGVPDTIIAFCLERNCQAIVTMLAIMKAGAAFLPIDPAYPDQRIQKILSDSRAALLLINTAQEERFNAIEVTPTIIVALEKFEREADDITCEMPSTELAYVIYTSGTTGEPHGVAVEHRALINTVYAAIEHRAIHADALVGQSASLAFDSSLLEIFPTLLIGATLHLLPEDCRRDIALLHVYCQKWELTHLFLTTQVALEFLQLESVSRSVYLSHLIIAGEKLPPIRLPTNFKVINEYGPTECAVAVTAFSLVESLSNVPIGTPLPNTKCYLLNKTGQLLPVGAVGELYVAGAGLARGYLHKLELTQTKFLDNHLQTAEERQKGLYSTLYKTGDLVRLLPSGELDYVGRADFQLKIRGYRVDLIEIEEALLQHPAVSQAVVIARAVPNSAATLIGYYVGREQISESELHLYLLQRLPEYMVPMRWMQLDKMPLTVNGKIDRKALIDVEVKKCRYVPPRNKQEEQICAMLAEVLGLPIETVGIEEDFFRLGGDSIAALRWAGRVRQRLGVRLSVKDILRYRVLREIFDIALVNEEFLLNSEDSTLSKDSIKKEGTIQAIFPANSLQQGLIVHALRQGEHDDAYTVQTRLDYHAPLDVKAYEEAWRYTQKQFSALRLAFDWKDELVQIVYREATLKFTYIEVLAENIEEEIRRLLQQDRSLRYQLAQPGLFRVYLIKGGAESFTTLLSYHHAILDGWSSVNLSEFVHRTYLCLVTQQPLPHAEIDSYLSVQEYVKKQHAVHQSYWREQLALPPSPIDLRGLLRTDCRWINIKEYREVQRQVEKTLKITTALYSQIKIFSELNGITLTTLLHYVWHKALSVFGNASNTVVGLVVSGRDLPVDNIEEAVGLCINTLPIRVEHESLSEVSLLDALYKVQEVIQSGQQHGSFSLASLQKGSERLFESLFVLENYPVHNTYLADNHLRGQVSATYEKSDYPLVLLIAENQSGLAVSLRYAEELFAEEMVEELLRVWQSLLPAIIHQPKQTVDSLPFVDPQSENNIFRIWNQKEVVYPTNKLLHQLFEEQVKQTPHKLALICEEERLTYSELNHRSNQLAHYLAARVHPDQLIPICVEPGIEMIIGILAILKAGGAYVPIDISQPDVRIKKILADTQAPFVLTSCKQQSRFAVLLGDPCKVMALSDTSGLSVNDPISKIHNHHLAYVIYTSGTTGQPKGVMIEHRSIVNSVLAAKEHRGITVNSEVTQIASCAFDSSILEIFPALVAGATLHLINEMTRKDLYLLHAYCQRMGITHLFLTTQLAIEFLKLPAPSLLEYLIVAGEKLPPVELLGYTVINEYGPTECAVVATSCQVIKSNAEVPIGKPIANVKCYILDRQLKLLPPGAIGELYIGGIGVARGYCHQSQLSVEKFILNPFQTEMEKQLHINQRLYKTGDLALWRHDGQLEFHGRTDLQVKIRGYRIELGEIEAAVLSYPGVQQVAVVCKTHNGHSLLVAYYVQATHNDIAEEKLVEHLRQRLPTYMVPSFFIKMAALPLTLQGKIDWSALPEAVFATARSVEPSNPTERAIRAVFAEVLGLEEKQISIDDSFFALGGDSILTIQLVGKLRQKLGYSIQVKDIFDWKSVARISAQITPASFESGIITEQGLLEGDIPLLPIQSWFFSQNFPVPYHWNQSFLIKTAKLNREQLEIAFQKCWFQHDAFRMRARPSANGYSLYYDATTQAPKIHSVDVSLLPANASLDVTLHNIYSEVQCHFDLETGPTCALIYLYNFPDGSARLFFAMHHLFIDAVSWRIITEDLYCVYHGGHLGPKSSSYRQWGYALKAYGKQHSDELSYWTATLALPQPQWVTTKELLINHFRLTSEQTRSLLRECHRTYHTEINDLLLTALGYAVAAVNGQPINAILLEGHGREEIAPELDVSRTVGWFTTMYPVRLEVDDSLGATIKRIKEELRAIRHHGIGFGALLGYPQEQLPLITFNYLGQFDKERSPTDSSKWRIVQEDLGDTIDPTNISRSLITVTGIVLSGQLELTISSYLNAEQTDAFGVEFKRKLEGIIQHCSQQETVEYTNSDFITVENETDLKRLPLYPAPDLSTWFPMTEVQKAYLLGRLSLYEIGNIANHTYSEYQYEYLDVKRVEWAINQLLAQQPVLRTVFSTTLLQQRFLSLNEISPYQVTVHDFSDQNFDASLLERVRETLSHKVYDPEQFPLFTYAVTQFKDRTVLHFSLDLILLDAESRRMLLQTLDQLYRDPHCVLPPCSITFKDYQSYFHGLKSSAWYARDKSYWQSKIAQMPSRPELSFLVNPENITQPRFAEYILYVKKGVWERFKARLSEANISHSSALLALYGKVIGYFAGLNEFLITMTLFNRYPLHQDIKFMWGDFTSTNLFHYLEEKDSLFETLQRTHRVMWEDIEHALYSGLEVQRDLARSRQLEAYKSVSPIVFTGVVGHRSAPATSSSFLSESELMALRYNAGQTSQAWIDLQAIEVEDGFMSRWMYVEQLFDRSYIAKMNQLYCSWIESVAENGFQIPEQLLPADDEKLIAEANSAILPISEDSLPSRFCRIAKQNNGKTDAVIEVESGIHYTYCQLYKDSEHLAKELILKHQSILSSSSIIAILVEKGYDQVVALLGTLRAGCIYLPLNPEWPTGRILEVMGQAGCSLLIISRRQYLSRIWNQQENSILLIEELMATPSDDNEFCLPHVRPDQIAYVIFTSGSTGKPKGVAITHRSALNTIDAVNKRFQIGTQDAILALSALSFDLSVYDIFGLLSAGGRIVFPHPDKIKDPHHWLDLLTRYEITIWNTVPQLAELLLESAQREANFSLAALSLILLSGDWIPIPLAQRLLDQIPQAKLMSLGGATEGSIWSIWYQVDSIHPDWKSIPYGIAMPNQKMYVLDSSLQMVPIGATSMIYIGGIGVAQGYWRDPELTASHFIQHPELGCLYKTGDLGRWSHQGYIEFLGRKDQQVKLHGYRIELEEINAKLSSLIGIEQAVVRVQKSSRGDQLVAYIVVAGALEYLEDEELKESIHSQLIKVLPSYMLPKSYMRLARLPLTENGKLDLARLPLHTMDNQQTTVLPRSDLERLIGGIWAEELKLPLERIGVTDDFFHLGGNSISAIKVMHRLNLALGLNNSSPYLFTHPTIELLIEQLAELRWPEIILPKTMYQNEHVYPLSFSQERLWFIDQYTRGTHAYNIPLFLRLNGAQVSAMIRAFKKIFERHESLRTIIIEDSEGTPSQCILDPYTYPLPITSKKVTNTEELHRSMQMDLQRSFALERDPPVRATIYELAKERYLGLILHHIACDGWSISILLKDLLALLREDVPALPELVTTYKDFAAWQRQYFNNEKMLRELNFWKERLKNYPTLNLPLDKPRPLEFDYQGGNYIFELEESCSHDLRKLAQRLHVSLFSLLLSSYFLLLKCYTAQEDLILGIPVAHRQLPQVNNLVGFFVNTLVIRIQVDQNETVFSFIKRVAHEVIQAQLHQDLPFEKLVDGLNIERDPSRHPLFQLSFAVQNAEGEIEAVDTQGQFSLYDLANDLQQTALFDITLYFDDSLPIIKGVFNYATSLFHESTIRAFTSTYQYLLKQLADLEHRHLEAASHKVRQMRWASEEMLKSIVCPSQNYPAVSLKDLFEAQTVQNPNAVAIRVDDHYLTYSQLNRKANQLAHFLKPHEGASIALLFERSDQQLIAMLAVIKAHAVFIPLDSSYPDERIKAILAQTQARLILTNQHLISKLLQCSIPDCSCVILDEIAQQLTSKSEANVPGDFDSHRLTYILFTSGSTGQPKGVMVEEHSVLNYIFNVQEQNLIKAGDRVDYSTSFGFDLSITTTLAALCLGAEVIIYPGHLQHLHHYLEHLSTHQIQVIKQVPSYFELLLNEPWPQALRVVILGGEKLSKVIIDKLDLVLINSYEQVRIYDEYGPTEATVGTTISCVYPDYNWTIGKPYKNCTIYVLDQNLHPLPFQALGELYIGGEGVARGYCENPEETAARFITNPFQTDQERHLKKNSRLYRTGDLVRLRPDGNLEYVGRNDRQVKLHGYRIELDEIQHMLSFYPGIKQNVVVLQKGKNLSAFYVLGEGIQPGEVNPEKLSSYLQCKLPHYMIPTLWYQLPEFPVTPHGKLDLSALSALPQKEPQVLFDPPQNEVEQILIRFFAEVLHLPSEQVRCNSDFFQMGGTSLSAIRLIHKINAHFDSHLKIVDLFSLRTIRGLVAKVFSERELYQPLVQLNLTLDKPLLFMIHPGAAGCEVYASLAQSLKDLFSVYGVEHYNLFHLEKISSLRQLAEYYLSFIMPLMQQENQREYHFLGWSLGGKIALEMATLLEAQGFNLLKVYLLDTILSDHHFDELKQQIDVTKANQAYRQTKEAEGYSPEYIERVLAALPTDNLLSRAALSQPLQHAKLLLFKALLPWHVAGPELNVYIASLKYNNLQQSVADTSQIKLIELDNTHHGNILSHEQLLRQAIEDFI